MYMRRAIDMPTSVRPQQREPMGVDSCTFNFSWWCLVFVSLLPECPVILYSSASRTEIYGNSLVGGGS